MKRYNRLLRSELVNHLTNNMGLPYDGKCWYIPFTRVYTNQRFNIVIGNYDFRTHKINLGLGIYSTGSNVRYYTVKSGIIKIQKLIQSYIDP